MDEDEKDFEEWKLHDGKFSLTELDVWRAARRTEREKIKSDPSIGKLVVDDWPESPDYYKGRKDG